MIICSSVREDFPKEAIVIAAVRSFGNLNPEVFHHVPDLAPSWDLFHKYRALANAGKWNRDTFNKVYRPQFGKEMRELKARVALSKVLYLDSKGYTVYVTCFCKDYSLCHRSLLAEIFKANGGNVVVK